MSYDLVQVYSWWWNVGLGQILEPFCWIWFKSRNRYLLLSGLVKLFHPFSSYSFHLHSIFPFTIFLSFAAKAARDGLDGDRQVFIFVLIDFSFLLELIKLKFNFFLILLFSPWCSYAVSLNSTSSTNRFSFQGLFLGLGVNGRMSVWYCMLWIFSYAISDWSKYSYTLTWERLDVAFDILYVGDTSVIHQSLNERHELLRKVVRPLKGSLEILIPNGGLNTHHPSGKILSEINFCVCVCSSYR